MSFFARTTQRYDLSLSRLQQHKNEEFMVYSRATNGSLYPVWSKTSLRGCIDAKPCRPESNLRIMEHSV